MFGNISFVPPVVRKQDYLLSATINKPFHHARCIDALVGATMTHGK